MKRKRQDVLGRKYIKNKKGEIKLNEKEIMKRLLLQETVSSFTLHF